MVESNEARDPVELLADDFIERCRRGERPSIDEYVQRHPGLAGEIRELFPTIAAIEQVKSASPGQAGGGPVGGGLSLERLGDFRIIRELGRGGMGIVYEAEQESLGRRVALKVLPRQLLLDSEQLRGFEREARTAAGLHHTNIVPIFGVGAHEGFHYFVMQYIRGVGLDVVLRELRRVLKNAGAGADVASSKPTSGPSRTAIDALSVARSLARDASAHSTRPTPESRAPSATPTPQSDGGRARSEGDRGYDGPATEDESWSDTTGTPRIGPAYWRGIARIALQAADALEHAHTQGTLHRDVKPSNLLIDADGTVWVADFGLAKALDQDGVTQTAGVVGTLRYMAPEQYEGSVDSRSDVYSLGLTLYELATLRPAFAETSRTTLINAITRGSPKAPRQCCPGMPRDLETIILKSIAREPDARYTSAGALAADLRCFLEDRPIQARRATASERLWRWSRRNPALAALSGTTAALLIAVAATSTVAYVHTSQANLRARNALAGEQEQRRKAEATSELALEALDTIFAEFAPRRTMSITTGYSESSDAQTITVPLRPVLSKETATLLEHMLKFYLRLAEQEGDAPAIRRKIAEANRRVGDIHQRLGHFEAAEKAYSQALDLYDELEKGAPGSPGVHIEIARIHNELGSMFVARERGREGQAQFSLAASTLEATQSAGQSSPETRFELARTYFLLGRNPRPPVPPPDQRRPEPHPPGVPLQPVGEGPPPPGEPPPPWRDPMHRPGPGAPPMDFRERGEYVQEAIAILTELSTAHPGTPSYRHLLALCYRELRPHQPGPFAGPSSDPRTQAVEILEQLARDFPGVPEYRFDLSKTYASLDEARTPGVPDPQDVERNMRAALRIMEELAAERPNVPDYVLSLARMYHKLGDVLRRAGRRDEVEGSLRRAVTGQSELARRFPEVGPYAVGQAMYQISLAELLFERDQLNEARELLEASMTILEGKVCQELGHGYVFDLSERGYRLLSDVLWHLGEHGLAEDAAERADESRRSRRDWRGPPRTRPP